MVPFMSSSSVLHSGSLVLRKAWIFFLSWHWAGKTMKNFLTNFKWQRLSYTKKRNVELVSYIEGTGVKTKNAERGIQDDATLFELREGVQDKGLLRLFRACLLPRAPAEEGLTHFASLSS